MSEALRTICEPDCSLDKGEHRHLCGCGVCWKHKRESFEDGVSFRKAHTCPGCGKVTKLKHIIDGDPEAELEKMLKALLADMAKRRAKLKRKASK